MKLPVLKGIASCMISFLAPAFCQMPSYTITTVAGGGSGSGGLGLSGPAVGALIDPTGIVTDSSGNIYVSDAAVAVILKITPDGNSSIFAGSAGNSGYSGDGTPAVGAQLGFLPEGLALDGAGNLYIADSSNGRIRKVDISGMITTVAGGGLPSAAGIGDGGQATKAFLSGPSAVAVDASGNLFIADALGGRIRKVTPDGIITTFAGNGLGPTPGAVGDGGPATKAGLVFPYGVALDSRGNIYIADALDNRIRKVSTNGIITTIAGNGSGSYSGDAGAATNSGISGPKAVAVDANGNIYIADTGDDRIRLVTAAGTINTIAGTGQIGDSGDSGPAQNATLAYPSSIALGPNGKIYIADLGQNEANAIPDSRVRLLNPSGQGNPPTISQNGIVSIYSTSTTVSPGSWVSIYGTNLAATTTQWNGNFPTSLGGVSVAMDSKPAYLWFVSPTQINLQVPDDATTGNISVVVTTSAGSAAATVTLGPFAPSFSLFNSKYPAAIVQTQGPGNSGAGYDYIGPVGAFSFPSRPVKAGETVILYGVGFGPTTPMVPAGHAFSGSATSITMPQITIGGVTASATFAGIIEAGLYQFNLVVPNVGSGDKPLLASIGGMTTPNTVLITLQ